MNNRSTKKRWKRVSSSRFLTLVLAIATVLSFSGYQSGNPEVIEASATELTTFENSDINLIIEGIGE